MPFDPQPPAAPRLCVLDAPDLLALDLPPRAALLGPVLTEGTLALLRGVKGVGKSYLALTIAQAVASAGKALMWQAPAPRRVLFVDADMPLALLQERLDAISRGQPSGTLALLAADAQEGALPALGTPAGLERLERHLAGVDLLVLDGLSSLIGPGPASRWLVFAAALRAWRRRGLAVLMVETGRLRGAAQAVEGLIEVTIALIKPFDLEAQEGGRCEVLIETARTRLGDAAMTIEGTLDSVDAEGTWTACDMEQAEMGRALRLHTADFSLSEIARRLGTSKPRVHRLIKRGWALFEQACRAQMAETSETIETSGTIETRETIAPAGRTPVRAA